LSRYRAPIGPHAQLDYLLADFAEHEGLFGTVSRAVASRLPHVLIRPLPLYLDEMPVVAET
jgi:hypothetical protein